MTYYSAIKRDKVQMCYMDKSQKQKKNLDTRNKKAEQKKNLDTRNYILYDSIFMKYLEQAKTKLWL